MKLYAFFFVIMASVFMPLPQSHAQDNCLPTRLVVGEQGVVIPPDPNRLRAEPSQNGEQLGVLEPNIPFDALETGTCANGITWVRVRIGNLEGWTAEANVTTYFIEPIAPTTANVSQEVGELSLINFWDKSCNVHYEGSDGYVSVSSGDVYRLSDGQLLLDTFGAYGNFSSDGLHVFLSNDGVYRLSDGEKLFDTLGKGGYFSPDGLYLVVTDDGVYRVSDWQKKMVHVHNE